jgi:hypothetical protein
MIVPRISNYIINKKLKRKHSVRHPVWVDVKYEITKSKIDVSK